MTQTHLDLITQLQKAHDRLRDARQRLGGVPDWMRELHEEHSGRKAAIDTLTAAVEQARLERRNAESEVDEHQEKLKKYQKQINEVQNQREYGALLQEIDTVKREIKETEERGFAAMERRENAEKALEEARRSFEELDQRYSLELTKWEAEKPEVEREAAALEAEIAELRKELPRPYTALFDRIYHRYGGNALAAVRVMDRTGRGPIVYHCEACNFRVRPQVVVEIKDRGSLVQCDSCKRILYTPEGGEAEEALA